VLPKSPLQGTQVDDVVLHTGSVLGQLEDAVHWTQVPEVVLQTGVPPEHCVLVKHATHSPLPASVASQSVDRQSVAPSAAVHGPSPLA
jgi:hypothetical protein